MRLAIIDLGTNSVRFDVHAITARNSAALLHRERLMVRLGQDVFVTGKLNREATRRTLQAFIAFQRTMTRLHVRKVIAVGTAVLREAEDRKRFIDQVRRRTGIRIEVIPGAEEARLIALGILANERLPDGKFVIVDIGGGSTEVSLCKGRKVLDGHSFLLGAARLQQVYLKQAPPTAEALAKLRRHIRREFLEKMSWAGKEGWPRPEGVWGASGTIRTLSRMLGEGREQADIALGELRRLVRRLSKMTQAEILTVPGIEPRRAEIILAGGVLLEEVMRALGIKRLRYTEFSLRDGILANEVALAKAHVRSPLGVHLPDIKAKAIQLGASPARVEKAVEVATLLFNRLARVHRLGKEWLPYLLGAVMLKETGSSISFIGSERHSYYIARHADIPSLQDWESEFIAELCRHHGDAKISTGELPFRGQPRRQRAFVRLLALLQITDALDSGMGRESPVAGVSVTSGKLRIRFKSRLLTDLESLRLERKKKFFEKEFHRLVFVEKAKS